MMPAGLIGQVFPLLKLIGYSLGMLGVLYLAYDFFDRRLKKLLRLVWLCSSWFLFTGVLSMSFVFLSLVSPGYLHEVIWRFVGIFSVIGFMMLVFYSSPMPASFPTLDWRGAIVSMVVMSIVLGGLGVIFAPNPLDAAFFILPSVLALGSFNGLAPVTQWWIIHLPERRVAVVGFWLIFCAFVMVFVHPLFSFLGIVVH